jgi:hypothetical protein
MVSRWRHDASLLWNFLNCCSKFGQKRLRKTHWNLSSRSLGLQLNLEPLKYRVLTIRPRYLSHVAQSAAFVSRQPRVTLLYLQKPQNLISDLCTCTTGYAGFHSWTVTASVDKSAAVCILLKMNETLCILYFVSNGIFSCPRLPPPTRWPTTQFDISVWVLVFCNWFCKYSSFSCAFWVLEWIHYVGFKVFRAVIPVTYMSNGVLRMILQLPFLHENSPNRRRLILPFQLKNR